MVRIAEGEHPHEIKESEYFTEKGEYRVDSSASQRFVLLCVRVFVCLFVCLFVCVCVLFVPRRLRSQCVKNHCTRTQPDKYGKHAHTHTHMSTYPPAHTHTHPRTHSCAGC